MLGEINHSPRTPFSAAWGVGWEGGSGPIFRAICIFLQTTKKEGGGGSLLTALQRNTASAADNVTATVRFYESSYSLNGDRWRVVTTRGVRASVTPRAAPPPAPFGGALPSRPPQHLRV